MIPLPRSIPAFVSTYVLFNALILGVGATNALAQWVIEGVHGSFLDPVVGEENSLVLDSSEKPHVAYSGQGETGYILWYSYKGVEVWWHQEKIDGASPNVGAMVSLAMDDGGNSHVAYVGTTEWAPDFFADYLKYARKSGGVWTIDVVDSSANSVGWTPWIIVDDDANPHVCYADGTASRIKYAHKALGVWTIEAVAGPSQGFCSLALDPSGDPHVTYENSSTRDLMYARKNGGVWTLETVDGSANSVGAWPSMAFDASGDLHVSYTDRTANDVKYARKSGGIWTIEVVDGAGISLWVPSLALDSFGNPHISYRDATNNNLKYARRIGGLWTLMTVNGEPNDEPQRNVLALDSFENPHLMYYEANAATLKYAHVPPTTGTSAEIVADRGRSLVVSPNPAAGGALRVLYRVGASSREADLTLYDVSGRRVRTLASGAAPSNPAIAHWDGRDDEARPVSAGVYFLRLIEGGVPRDVKRVTVIR